MTWRLVRLVRPGVIAVMLAALAVLAPRLALAHGALKSSVPRAGAHLGEVPHAVRLDFNEAPELAFTSIRLLSADGREIALGALAYAPDSHRAVVAPIASAMIAGTYTVAWQMAGDDGHPVRGRFVFVVAPGAMGVGVVPASLSPGSAQDGAGTADTSGRPTRDDMHHDAASVPQGEGFGAESPLYVLVRWLQFVALLLVIGASSFRFLVVPLARRASPGDATLLGDGERRAASIGSLAAALLALVLVLRLGAQSYAMHGDAMFAVSLSVQMIRNTMWGWGWLIQLVGVLLAVPGFYGALTAARRQRDATTWWRLAALGAVVAAFSPAFSGHAAASPRMRALAMVADGVHVLGASSWLGTLAIVLFVGLTGAQAPSGMRNAFVRDLIRAFSPVALASAAIAASTGLFAAWIHVGTLPNLWTTRYGLTLLLKLGILGIVAGTGLYNWRVVTPRLGTDDATVLLRRSTRVEVVVALLVLAVTAVLVATPASLDMDM